MTGVSWIWVVVAVPLLAAGVVLVARFVLGDRSRGRLRCPKCWYDMNGGGEKCPECGRVVRSERDLRRSRRPKRWAVAGVGLLVLGGASLATRQAVVHGAVSLVPDWVLVAGMERWPSGGELRLELHRRHREGELSPGEQRRLLRKSIGLLEPETETNLLRYALSIITNAAFLGGDEAERHTKPWQRWVVPSEVMGDRELALRIMPFVVDPQRRAGDQALIALGQLPTRVVVAAPTVMAWAHEHPSSAKLVAKNSVWTLNGVWHGPARPYLARWAASMPREGIGPLERPEVVEFLTTLRDTGTDLTRMRGALLDGMHDPSAGVRAVAMWMLRAVFWPDEEARLAALAMYDADDPIAAAIVDFAVSGPLDELALTVLQKALRSDEPDQWKWAVDRLGERGKEAAALGDELRELLGTFKASDCVVSYASVTGDRELPADVLLAIAMREPRRWGPGLLEDFGRIGWSGERVVAFLTDYLTANDPLDRLCAAAALLRLGAPEGTDKAELTRIMAEAMIAKYGSLSMTKAFTDAVRFGETDIPEVINFLGDCSARGSGSVVRALGMAGTAAEQALPWLHEFADNQPSVNWEAEYAIRRIEWCLKHGDPPPEPRGKW